MYNIIMKQKWFIAKIKEFYHVDNDKALDIWYSAEDDAFIEHLINECSREKVLLNIRRYKGQETPLGMYYHLEIPIEDSGEFDSYIWDIKNTVKEVPLKINDDCMDAIRYAIYTHRSKLGEVDIFEGDYTITENLDW